MKSIVGAVRIGVDSRVQGRRDTIRLSIAYIVIRPLDLIRKHTVHMRYDLHRHVYQSLAEYETDVILRLKPLWSEEGL